MGHKEREETISTFWEKNKIFEKSVEQRPKNKQYVFYDGPPFATGTPHYGHILGLTSKDVFPRFWTMKGFRVERRWGWDCHGLPIENIAEKELGIKEKKQIEEMGIEKFNEFCRSKVLSFAKEWKKTITRMGKWIEFDNAYKTMDPEYMETIWYLFKKLYEDKLIYEGKKVLLYCPRCETRLATSEIAMDNSYKDITEKTAIGKYDLPIIQHVNTQGKLHQGPKEWQGLWFKKADEKVLQDLEKRNLLYKSGSYTHPYPFCYRCETPLFYNALDAWFVDIQKVKEKILKKNKEINWHPEHIKEGRFKYILENAPDWCISRNRFWATAIPVWKCTKCPELVVIGSVKELAEKALEKVPKELDLHKHVVDKIHLKCMKCKGTMNRIPEVMDCWFESGSMPYAAKHYPFENKEWFKDNFPADFISEYIAQTRTWFYYMHVLGVLLFDKPSFKHVIVTGTILASDGSKMSKSKGNYPDPSVIFDK